MWDCGTKSWVYKSPLMQSLVHIGTCLAHVCRMLSSRWLPAHVTDRCFDVKIRKQICICKGKLQVVSVFMACVHTNYHIPWNPVTEFQAGLHNVNVNWSLSVSQVPVLWPAVSLSRGRNSTAFLMAKLPWTRVWQRNENTTLLKTHYHVAVNHLHEWEHLWHHGVTKT